MSPTPTFLREATGLGLVADFSRLRLRPVQHVLAVGWLALMSRFKWDNKHYLCHEARSKLA